LRVFIFVTGNATHPGYSTKKVNQFRVDQSPLRTMLHFKDTNG